MSGSNTFREQLKLLSNDSPRTPEPSVSRAANSPPAATPRHRPGYARIPSVSVIDEQVFQDLKPTTDSPEADDITQAPRSSPAGHGLGIAIGTGTPSRARRVSIQSIPRVAVSTKGTPEQQQTPGSADPLISPPSTGGFSGSTRYDGTPTDFDTSYQGAKHFGKQSVSSLHSTIPPSFRSDTGLVSIRSKYDEWEPQHNCRSNKHVKQKVGSRMSTTILILAIFSTVFSAAFLIIALRGPRYGRRVGTNGTLTPSSAAFLTSFMAKLIELAFVTVLVAFLGQALARRAFKLEDVRGVTLAELNMRAWVMQPGTVFTRWETVRYAGTTALGLIALLGAVAAILYTSAATALVQPQLKYPKWQSMEMQGLVKTIFANPTYIGQNCKTPITATYDPANNQATCIQLEHAAMGYHNYFGYLGIWTDVINNGTGSSDPAQRPKGFALLNDNTTVTAPWIEHGGPNVTELYWQNNSTIINNVSMAMPHPGVIQAAMDTRNNIMQVIYVYNNGIECMPNVIQPAELEGEGSYNIRASVPSSVVHVLCVTLNTTALKPFVYGLWDDAELPVNMSSWPAQLSYADPYLNGTAFDDIFEWGPSWGDSKWPPVFAQLPIDYNTVLNDTGGIPYGRDSVYVLGKGGVSDSEGNPTETDDYSLCKLSVSLTPYCSTQYNASASGGTLEAICEDPNDKLAYNWSLSTATSGNYSVSKDWPNIASEWGRSLSLNDGFYNGNGSNARLLTQLILTTPQLNPALPSMAEALAVMAGCTLLQSATDAPFVEFWNYTLPSMTPGQYQNFNASVRAQQYQSGGTQAYQKAFTLVLFAVFGLNVMALVYFVTHQDWYTDFSEPTNLFSLAVNSPPSKELAGSCGGGPAGGQFNVSWKLNRDGEHVFMESREKDEVENEGSSPRLRRRRVSEGLEVLMSPLRKAGTFELRRSK
ncbi:hypothetical protein LTR85_011062 [Meristemomyces frigidus]|nr:hypothetical protein LTR85_011062 [Meristemomyces frigidus]